MAFAELTGDTCRIKQISLEYVLEGQSDSIDLNFSFIMLILLFIKVDPPPTLKTEDGSNVLKNYVKTQDYRKRRKNEDKEIYSK